MTKITFLQDITGHVNKNRINYANKGDVMQVLMDRGDGSYLIKGGKRGNFIVFEKDRGKKFQ